MVWALQTLRPYIESTKFIMGMDHDVLRWLMSLTESSCRLTAWCLRLADYNFTITYGTEESTKYRTFFPVSFRRGSSKINEKLLRQMTTSPPVKRTTIGLSHRSEPLVKLLCICRMTQSYEKSFRILLGRIVQQIYAASRNLTSQIQKGTVIGRAKAKIMNRAVICRCHPAPPRNTPHRTANSIAVCISRDSAQVPFLFSTHCVLI